MSFLNDLRSRITSPWSSPLRKGISMPSIPGAGVFHYLRETPSSKVRLHLRLENDGRGLLLVNASRAFHLNQSAAFMAYMNLEGETEDNAVQALVQHFRVSKADARRDYRAFCYQLEIMTSPDEHCPVCELDLETTAPFSDRPSAPYRMDLAITYRCNNNCAHCYNARPRQYPELSTGQWKHILDTLWQVGIPHIVFTGGEPTLRADLPELIAHAEKNGQITGINTNGRRLMDPEFLQSLLDAGLDHVQITLESHNPAVHDAMVRANGAWENTVAGLKNVLSTRLYVMTNTTLLRRNAPFLAQTLDFLADTGVPTVGLNALIYSGRGLEVDSGLPESELPPLLDLARDATTRRGQRLIWYTPTRYCHFDPMQLDLGVKGCTAALYNMCVEPDGSVLPCQSYYQPLGNLLLDPWERIWNHDLAVSLRERRNLPIDCQACALLVECGGGCPLARQANPKVRPHAIYADLPGLSKKAAPEPPGLTIAKNP
ncbi:MAG: radical SAM protein [Chloroflexi bacterium]|nr:MAG: radical SAM protein [Chloroflexota bacterium]